MLLVRYLIAFVFSIFVLATSLRIEERTDDKISTPDRLVLQTSSREAGRAERRQQLEPRRLGV